MTKKKKKRNSRSLNDRGALPNAKKALILADAEELVRSTFTGDLHASCLYWAGAVLIAGKRHGVPLLLQAGSCSWRRLPVDLDDGLPTTYTHFTYLWEGVDHPKVRARLATGDLPEMHVWVADPKRREVIDPTTRFMPQQCEEKGHMPWLSPPPPPFVWTGAAGLAEHDCFYGAARDACIVADLLLTQELTRVGLVGLL